MDESEGEREAGDEWSQGPEAVDPLSRLSALAGLTPDAMRTIQMLFGGGWTPWTLPCPPPFPNPSEATSEGLVAIGGGLSPELILDAYRQGIFPMADELGGIGWYSPDPRTVIGLDELHVPRRLRRTLRRGKFEIRVDTDFEAVIEGCADRPETWISGEFRQVYGELFEQGHVHTVEAWHEGQLAGGLYGVNLGGAFMAESMFHRVTDASKAAVVGLVERMRERGLRLLDIQYETNATAIFRPRAISRDEYLGRLREVLELSVRFG